MARIIKATEMIEGAEPRVAALRLKELAAEVRDAVVDARRQAARIISAAREQSRKIEFQAEERGYHEGYARGRTEGHNDGFRQGQAQGRRELAAEGEPLLQLARQIVNRLGETDGEAGGLARGQWIELAVMLADRVVRRVGEWDIQAAKDHLATALDLADARGPLRVLVNPTQLNQLRTHLPQLVEAFAPSADVEFVGDANIEPGGVKLLSGSGEVDATLRAQLDSLAEALLGSDYRRDLGHYEPAAAPKAVQP